MTPTDIQNIIATCGPIYLFAFAMQCAIAWDIKRERE